MYINVSLYQIPIYVLYSICGIARLAYFNIKASNTKPVPYYEGLPVTYIALIFPIGYLFSYILKENIFIYLINIIMIIVSIFYILKIKVPKPKLKISIGLSLLAIIVIITYIFI